MTTFGLRREDHARATRGREPVGPLQALIEAVLADKHAVSVHDRMRSLVGDEWLDARGLL
jgi:hypothetical protein